MTTARGSDPKEPTGPAALQACHEEGRVGVHRTWCAPAYEALHRQAATGQLGRIVVARFSRSEALSLQGRDPAEDRVTPNIFLDQLVQDLDHALRLCGPAVRVYAMQRASKEGSTVTGMVTLSHRSGAVSHITGLLGPTWVPGREAFRVVGTAATLTHDSIVSANLRVRGQARPAGETIPPGAWTAELPRQVLADDGPRTTSAELQTARVAEAASESARSGRAIVLDPSDPEG